MPISSWLDVVLSCNDFYREKHKRPNIINHGSLWALRGFFKAIFEGVYIMVHLSLRCDQ